MVSVGALGTGSGKILGGGIYGSMSDDEWNQFLANEQKGRSRQSQIDQIYGRKHESERGATGNMLVGGLPDFLKSDSYKSLTDQAKDMARFRLGLDKEQAEFSYGLRDREAEGNFGRQYKLDTQQRQFDRDINTDTQSALTQRLEKELTNRLEQQEKGINQENFATNRAIRLASRRLGG